MPAKLGLSAMLLTTRLTPSVCLASCSALSFSISVVALPLSGWLTDRSGRLMPLMLANFVEANPVPVKAAMAAMGLIEDAYRLPMVGPKPESKEKIVKTLKDLGLVKGAYV